MNNRDINQSMYDYLPKYYEDVREVRAIVDGESASFDRLHADIDDVLAQFFVDTATWGLANWERLVGVTVDESKPLNQRRSVVKSKLRGIGTVTVALIKNVAESWYGGEVEVVEQAGTYTIVIKFVSDYGVPENLADVERALRDIIPAHLDIQFEFKYVLYQQLAGVAYRAFTGLTYDELLTTLVAFDGTTHAVMQTMTYGSLSAYAEGQIEGGAIDG